MIIDDMLMLAVIGGLGILAPCVGLIAYKQLAGQFGLLPAATQEPGLAERVVQLGQERAMLEQVVGELKGMKGEFDYWRAQVETARQEVQLIEPRRLELDQVSHQLADAQEKLARVEADHAGRLAAMEELARRHDGLEVGLTKLAQEKKSLLGELEGLQPQSAAVRQQLEADRVALADIQARMLAGETQARQNEAQLRELLAARSTATQELERLQQRKIELEAAIGEQEREHRARQEALAALAAELQQKHRLSETLDATDQDLQQAEAQLRELERKRTELNATIAALTSTLRTLESTTVSLTPEGSTGPGDDPLAELRRTPSSFRPALRSVPTLDELQALDQLRKHLAGSGLQFAERTLQAFHTCLKIADISPLTVLAGISGTGKSALPRRYAEALGLEFLQVPVQPRWDGPQDLIGFYNYLEKRFKATELSQTLVRLDRRNWSDLVETFDDRVVLVLLDEMNLARVEYYFSDFLSLLETRRESPDDAVVPIDLGQVQRSLQLVPNALFVGTMNEDESTQSLSDKVLDRANLLRFGRPRSFDQPPPPSPAAPLDGFLPKRLWDGWRRYPKSLPANARSDLDRWIERLNAALDRLGRPFGHRVQQAILAYAANHPALGQGALADIFIDQMEQRILPKLRGLDPNTEDAPMGLDQIEALLREIAPGDQPIQDALNRARGQPLFVWAGALREP